MSVSTDRGADDSWLYRQNIATARSTIAAPSFAAGP
jgi:hypothetical protein